MPPCTRPGDSREVSGRKQAAQQDREAVLPVSASHSAYLPPGHLQSRQGLPGRHRSGSLGWRGPEWEDQEGLQLARGQTPNLTELVTFLRRAPVCGNWEAEVGVEPSTLGSCALWCGGLDRQASAHPPRSHPDGVPEVPPHPPWGNLPAMRPSATPPVSCAEFCRNKGVNTGPRPCARLSHCTGLCLSFPIYSTQQTFISATYSHLWAETLRPPPAPLRPLYGRRQPDRSTQPQAVAQAGG